MKRVFIDGSAGTTGLRIRERLATRADLRVVVLADDVRKDPEARRAALNDADVAFLCLPDAAAVEAVAMVENPKTVVIDTSTAHRTADGWEYGFPELAGRRARIAHATRIANPGCHASGFIALVEPLVLAGVLPRSAQLAAFSLTGYSGGGKKMIAAYEESGIGAMGGMDAEGGRKTEGNVEAVSHRFEQETTSALFLGGRQYALAQSHKHLPEMAKICGLEKAPIFSPIVVPHYSGMEVTVQVAADQFRDLPPGGVLAVLKKIYKDYYKTGLVRFVDDPAAAEGGFLSSAALTGRDVMEVSVYGNEERVLLISRFDNLGKGASGAAIQNMNIVLGCAEDEGLTL